MSNLLLSIINNQSPIVNMGAITDLGSLEARSNPTNKSSDVAGCPSFRAMLGLERRLKKQPIWASHSNGWENWDDWSDVDEHSDSYEPRTSDDD